MAQWEVENTTTTHDTSVHITNTSDTREAVRAGAAETKNSSNAGFLGLASNYSVVGLNTESVETMRDAIREWVALIHDHLSGIDASADASGAYKSASGEVEAAVKAYVENVKEYCINLTSNLLTFSDKLADVKAAWIANTGNLSGVITSDTQASAAGEKYTESL